MESGSQTPAAAAAGDAMTKVRLVLSLAGLALAAVGAVRNDRTLIWAAIVAISVSIGLRMASKRRKS